MFKDDDNPTLEEWMAAGEEGCAAWYARHGNGPGVAGSLPQFPLVFATQKAWDDWWKTHPMADEMETVSYTIVAIVQPKV